jgi:hypothetical protein
MGWIDAEGNSHTLTRSDDLRFDILLFCSIFSDIPNTCLSTKMRRKKVLQQVKL